MPPIELRNAKRWAKNQKPEKYKRCFEILKTSKVKGLYHHIFVDYKPACSDIEYIHLLSKSSNPKILGVASVVLALFKKQKIPSVVHSIVHPKHKGLGYGRLLYAQTVKYHGKIKSDRRVSKMATEVYKSFRNIQGYKVKIAKKWNRRHFLEYTK